MRKLLNNAARWLARKTMPPALAGGQWSGTGYVDAYKRNRNPSPNELLAELKATAWTCASLNAQTCASHQPKLYVTTKHNQPRPKCPTRPLTQKRLDYVKNARHLAVHTKRAEKVEEVTTHPLLDLFQSVNPVHNSFDLWELTTLYQEVHGSAYWYLCFEGPLGTPSEIWIMPSQNMTPKRKPNSKNLVDYYEYRTGTASQEFKPDEIIHFRYPDPRDPYTSGLSPLRACFEQVALASDYTAFKKAKFENHAIPDVLVSPDEVVGEEERTRLENEWNSRFRRGGSGRALFAENKMTVDVLNYSMGDMAALAEQGANKEMIMNAFHVPVAFFSSSTNLANLQASQSQHAAQCIGPRIVRRDEKMNEQLIPLYDDSGRLFLATDNPEAPNPEQERITRQQDLTSCVRTINEVRADDGLPPVKWGDLPWMASTLVQPGQTPPTQDGQGGGSEPPDEEDDDAAE